VFETIRRGGPEKPLFGQDPPMTSSAEMGGLENSATWEEYIDCGFHQENCFSEGLKPADVTAVSLSISCLLVIVLHALISVSHSAHFECKHACENACLCLALWRHAWTAISRSWLHTYICTHVANQTALVVFRLSFFISFFLSFFLSVCLSVCLSLCAKNNKCNTANSFDLSCFAGIRRLEF
jgi:hypothetical protein